MEGQAQVPPEQIGIATKRVETPPNREREKPPLDALLVFGQGPVIEKETRKRADDVGKTPGSEDINLWSQTLAEAASELYKRGQMREIIIMGGRTEGEAFQSEAELIARLLKEEYKLPSDVIKIEARSINTLENIVNMLNDYPEITKGNIGVLTSNYHLARVRLLGQLFDTPYKSVFSAEEVVRYVARGNDVTGEEWDLNKLLEIEKRLDIGQASKTPVSEADKRVFERYGYYQTKNGTEKKDVARRAQEENVWSRALLEIPEYWIGYLGRLNNANRIREILTQQDKNVLKERLGIDLLQDNDTILKEKLLSIERKLPGLEEWLGKDWSEETIAKLQEFIEQRKKSS